MEVQDLIAFEQKLTALAALQGWHLNPAAVEMISDAAFPLDAMEAMRILDQYAERSEYTKPADLLSKLRERVKGQTPVEREPEPVTEISDELARAMRYRAARANGTAPEKFSKSCKYGTCTERNINPCDRPPGYQPTRFECQCLADFWNAPLTDADMARIMGKDPEKLARTVVGSATGVEVQWK